MSKPSVDLAASPSLPSLVGHGLPAAGYVLGVPVCAAPESAMLWARDSFVIYSSGQAPRHHPTNLVPMSSASVAI